MSTPPDTAPDAAASVSSRANPLLATLRRFASVRGHSRRVLIAALATSLGVHLAATQWPAPLPDETALLPPLAATITELPPPPAPLAVAPQPKPKPKRRATVPTVPVAPVAVEAAPVIAEPEVQPPAEVPPAPVAEAPEESPPPTEEAVPVAAAEPSPLRDLPPRVDLVYRGFLGTHGFLIGDATCRLEHSGNRYSISTVGQARGLAALFYRGQGRVMSEGVITQAGLQPHSYSVERLRDHRREAAAFDWDTGIVLLNDDKSAPLELPTYDPLAMLWQFYYAPPDADDVQLNIATTRKVYHYSFHRVGTETVELPMGSVETQVWQRQSGDGSFDARVWLAPSLHFLAVKLRLANDRFTVEALLDSIRVDETVAQQ